VLPSLGKESNQRTIDAAAKNKFCNYFGGLFQQSDFRGICFLVGAWRLVEWEPLGNLTTFVNNASAQAFLDCLVVDRMMALTLPAARS
jgi:hypothetical protein